MDNIPRLNIAESDSLLMTILIGFSLRGRDIYFELHRIGTHYKLFWRLEPFPTEVFSFMSDNGLKGLSYDEAQENPRIIEFCRNFHVQGPVTLGDSEILPFEVIISEGLPDVERKPWGLDGHSYEITVIGEPDRLYKSWCVLPKGWDILVEVIEILRKHAGLGEEYRPDWVKT